MSPVDLETLYRRHRDFVFRTCSRYAASKSDGEDLTQEAFVKASRNLGKFRGESEWATWLYRVAVNTCLDYLRKRKRESRNLAEFLDEMVVHNLEASGDRTLAKLEMERILRPLRPQLRVILFMTLAEGLTYAETAEVLHLTEAAVAKSVSRFLGKYRKETIVHSGGPAASKGISQHA